MMKFFKNIVAVLVLFFIGSTHAKQVGKKATTTAPITTPTKAASQPKTKEQPQRQQETFRQFLTELRNMKTSDVFTPDKSKFTDKVVQLFARIKISSINQLEYEELFDALLNLHVVGTIISVKDMFDPSKEKEVEAQGKSFFTDLKTRLNALIGEQRLDLAKKEKEQTFITTENTKEQWDILKECINAVLRKNDDLKGENALWYVIYPDRYNFDKITIVLNNIIAEVSKCSANKVNIKSILISSIKGHYSSFNNLKQEQQNQIINYIKSAVDKL